MTPYIRKAKRLGMTKRHQRREICEHWTTRHIIMTNQEEKVFKQLSRLICSHCGRKGYWGWQLDAPPIPTGPFPTLVEDFVACVRSRGVIAVS
jgi:hypothetical protein